MNAHANHDPFLAKVAQRDAEAAARMSAPTPAPASKPIHSSKAQWAKPLAHQHANFIPAQSFLAYSWIDKDPELDMVKYAIEESGMTLEQIEHETEKVGHKVSRYTLLNWYFGQTKRPQNVTMSTVMAILGWERPWKRKA